MLQQATTLSILLGLALCTGAGCASFQRQSAPPPRNREQAEQCNQRGLELATKDQLEQAEKALRDALRADPYLGPAHCNLGIVLLRQGKLFDAGWELREACQLMPQASQPRTNLGILYATVGRYGLAEENLQAALRLAPGDLQVIGQLAVLRLKQEHCDDDTLAWLKTIYEQDNDPAWRSWAGEKLVLLKAKS